VAEAPTTPEERGRLDIRLTAVERTAELAARHVPGTVAHTGRLAAAGQLAAPLGRLAGTRYPRASVTLRGGRARVEVDVAAPWPSPVALVAARVRDRVRDETTRITGIEIRSVDVTVHAVGGGRADEERRRVE
jgi:uncharacterized alkaline shock family protein YloU